MIADSKRYVYVNTYRSRGIDDHYLSVSRKVKVAECRVCDGRAAYEAVW